MLGDRWSILILRDMMLRGSRTFKEFADSYERIATNILTDRLRKLEAYGIIASHQDPEDGRKLIYTLTAKGIDLAPVLTEMVLWAARHEDTGNAAFVQLMRADKQKFLADIRRRCAENQPADENIPKHRAYNRIDRSLLDGQRNKRTHRG